MLVRPLGGEDPLEEEMATHSSVIAWRVPWTGEPGDYSPWGRREFDTTVAALHACMHDFFGCSIRS